MIVKSGKILNIIFAVGLLGLPFERLVIFKYGAEFNISYMATLFLVAYSVFYLIKVDQRVITYKSIHNLIFIYLFTMLTLFLLLLNGEGVVEYIKSMIQLYVFVVPLIVLGSIRFDGSFIRKIVSYITIIIIATILIEVFFLIINTSPPKLFGVDFVGMYNAELKYRLSGSFTEPSQLATLSSVLLVYYLFQKRTKNNVIFIIVILTIILGSQSLSGIIISTAGLLGWLTINNKLNKQFIGSVLIVVVLSATIISYTEFGNYIIYRVIKFKNSLFYIFNSGLDINSASGVYRIVSNLLFLTLEPSDWVLGLGFSGVDDIGINSVLSSQKITSSLSFIIITSGYAGLALFIYLFSRLFKINIHSYFKLVFAVHMLTLLTSGSLLKPYFWWVIYFCIAGSGTLFNKRCEKILLSLDNTKV